MFSTEIYDFPLCERVRKFLRIEQQYQAADYVSQIDSDATSAAALQYLLDLLSSIESGDLKLELSKELETAVSRLMKLREIPELEIDSNSLSYTIDALNTRLQHIEGSRHANKILRQDEFLNTLRQKITRGGLASFEIPSYHAWLSQSFINRKQQLQNWLAELLPYYLAIHEILELFRNSGEFKSLSSSKGFYQSSITGNRDFGLVRVAINKELNIFPEISGNKHRISIRFLQNHGFSKKASQISGELDFELALC